MSLIDFLYPIADSGYFFRFDLLEVTKTADATGFLLSFRYSLHNDHPLRFQIPINIMHKADPDCQAERDFDRTNSPRAAYSRSVLNLQTGQAMYGYGSDHHVVFEPFEKKEFQVLFPPFAADFETFDTEFFMKPENQPYGRYRLRFDFKSGQITKGFCLKKIPLEMR